MSFLFTVADEANQAYRVFFLVVPNLRFNYKPPQKIIMSCVIAYEAVHLCTYGISNIKLAGQQEEEVVGGREIRI